MPMLTQCAQCSTVYRIHAPQLAAAHGFVTCGECNAVFNALNHLADEPPVATHAGSATDPVLAALTEGAVEIRIEMPAEVRRAPAAHPAATEAAFDLDDVPEVLREDVARLMRRRRLGVPALWGLLAFGALLALCAQVAWTYRAWWSERYPAVVPFAERLCEMAGCSFAPALNVAGIELVARDVREHPQYAHALLVNATLANRSAKRIAYPVIQLAVYDRNGGVVGVRRFAPAEYLDASIDIARGMPAGRTVYVVLEIAGASDVADSFEFAFL